LDHPIRLPRIFRDVFLAAPYTRYGKCHHYGSATCRPVGPALPALARFGQCASNYLANVGKRWPNVRPHFGQRYYAEGIRVRQTRRRVLQHEMDRAVSARSVRIPVMVRGHRHVRLLFLVGEYAGALCVFGDGGRVYWNAI